jgi:hypothetical protein
MTKRKAKEICLEIWGYLKDNPDVKDKEYLPQELWDLISGLLGKCPLCELYRQNNCQGCPLFTAGEWCFKVDSPFSVFYCWYHAIPGPKGNAKRRKSAGRIYDIVEAWEVY